jgi:hypothetical protein
VPFTRLRSRRVGWSVAARRHWRRRTTRGPACGRGRQQRRMIRIPPTLAALGGPANAHVYEVADARTPFGGQLGTRVNGAITEWAGGLSAPPRPPRRELAGCWSGIHLEERMRPKRSIRRPTRWTVAEWEKVEKAAGERGVPPLRFIREIALEAALRDVSPETAGPRAGLSCRRATGVGASRDNRASLLARARSELAPRFRTARSWLEIEAHVYARGFSLHEKGPGLVIRYGDQDLPISQVEPSASRRRLEHRLGPYRLYRSRGTGLGGGIRPTPRPRAPSLAKSAHCSSTPRPRGARSFMSRHTRMQDMRRMPFGRIQSVSAA